MPQLMPFMWMNSVFMIFFVLITLVFFYFYKNMEEMIDLNCEGEIVGLYKMLW